ncbi:AcrR family transcriptional regulator/transposase-like protein [Nonomuraea thailandensis]|uniref:AcrR family transcriptional regulator/transposase-like protein n=1 Tax=Nonomuraea thailandensis TaxID=1188745 RepID=A0A9X2GDE0_9ACTN|nr:TetR family transcriptional regulator [Nonomuraea thailandensis]MCP2353251.1 AcrR family transcriptional regulator/transposase-like protein [Nonomuraea thailandensis]
MDSILDEDACLEQLWRVRFSPDGRHAHCQGCDQERTFHRLHNRRVYSCAHCGEQLSPTARTPFHGSSTPLRLWFAAIVRERASGGRLTAQSLADELGLSYATAWRLLKKLREHRDEIDALAPAWQAKLVTSESDEAGLSREEQLLQAARAVVVAYGLDATTIRAVARHAGLSTGVVHYYFENKNQILVKALRQANDEACGRRDAIMAAPGLSAAERLARLILLSIPESGVEREEFILWFEYFRVAIHGQIADADTGMADRFRQYFFDVIEQGVVSGEFQPEDPPADIVEQLLGLLDGLGIAAVMGRRWMSCAYMHELVRNFAENSLRVALPAARRV